MSTFYEIDSRQASYREYWWGSPSPLVLIAWMIKLLHIRIPSSADDPNTDSTLPFVVPCLPTEISASFTPRIKELTGLGFLDPVYHVIYDPGTRTTIYWATFRHQSGKYFARIHHRVWQQAAKFNRGLFPVFFTEFTDGTFLLSSSGKPDIAAPATVEMKRLPRARTSDLWNKHLQLLAKLETGKQIAPSTSQAEIIAATERHHVLVRDFHLARGFFRLRTTEEQTKVDSYVADVAQAQTQGLEHAEILAELENLQKKKPGWRGALWMLAASVVLFFVIGAAGGNWKFTLWLVPALFLHESGHWLAMRLFKYQNLRMFFIPLFGAAVTGQNWNAPGWKKALVSLAGPLPGIALGGAMGIFGALLKQPSLMEAAFILMLLNGFNLLPILPLDGGHVLQAVLFCRNRWLDLVFRVLTIAGLFTLSAVGLGKIFMYLIIPMVISLPLVFKLAKVTDKVRTRTDLPPPAPEDRRIPCATAQAIISEIKSALPQNTSNKAIAQHTLSVFENINAKPPGIFASIGLLTVHGAGIAFAVLFGIFLVVAKQGDLGSFFRAAAHQPQHRLERSTIRVWNGTEANASLPHNLLVVTFERRVKAAEKFDALVGHLPPASRLTLFGDSLLLSLPASDDAARELWFDRLTELSTNVFVSLSNRPVVLNLTCIAPDAAAASNLVEQARDYFSLPAGLHLIPPWSPEARNPEFNTHLQTRRAWRQIDLALANVWTNAALNLIDKKMEAARKRGATAELKKLSLEQQETVGQLQAVTRERLGTDPACHFSSTLLSLHARLSNMPYTNRVERAALLRQAGLQLGEVPCQDGRPTPAANACGASFGNASTHGMMVQFSCLSMDDAPAGLHALADWLYGQNCVNVCYELASGFEGEVD